MRPSTSADFNGDRKPDFAIAAGEDTLWGMRGGRGRVYVVAGRDVWPRVLDVNDAALLVVEGTAPASTLAPPLLSDVNGDGFAARLQP